MNLDLGSGIKEDWTVPRYWASARLTALTNTALLPRVDWLSYMLLKKYHLFKRGDSLDSNVFRGVLH